MIHPMEVGRKLDNWVTREYCILDRRGLQRRRIEQYAEPPSVSRPRYLSSRFIIHAVS